MVAGQRQFDPPASPLDGTAGWPVAARVDTARVQLGARHERQVCKPRRRHPEAAAVLGPLPTGRRRWQPQFRRFPGGTGTRHAAWARP